jgi:hypothetical protein
MPDDLTVKMLLELQERLSNLIAQKQTQMAALDQEIKEMQESIYQISKLISVNSFMTADTLVDTETFLQQHEEEPISGPSLTRKIFSEEEKLEAFLKYDNGTVFIRISRPDERGITSERYITGFVKTTLVDLKQIEPDLKPVLTKVITDNEEYIDTITLQNIQHLESLDIIEKGIQSLLGINME